MDSVIDLEVGEMAEKRFYPVSVPVSFVCLSVDIFDDWKGHLHTALST